MPYAALGALTPVRPYELYGYLTLNQRAEACLRSKNGIQAAVDYKKSLPTLESIPELLPIRWPILALPGAMPC